MSSDNLVKEKTMKIPIPPDLLAQLLSHQQYKETQGKEGKKLKAEGLDLSELDLSGRNLSDTDLQRQGLIILTCEKRICIMLIWISVHFIRLFLMKLW